MKAPPIGPPPTLRRAGSFANRLAEAFRALPVPVFGRIEDGQLRLDLRCLDGAAEEQTFVAQLGRLRLGAGA